MLSSWFSSLHLLRYNGHIISFHVLKTSYLEFINLMIEWSNDLFYNDLNYCRLHKLHPMKSYVLKIGVEIIFFNKDS